MTCRTETKVIGEREYSVTQWPAEKSMIMKFKLTKVLGVSLAKVASLATVDGKTKLSDAEQVKAFSEGLSSLFECNSPEEIVSLIKSCVVGVACNGKRITETSFNEVFSTDDLLEVYKVFLFTIQVNFGNFLKGQLVENLLAKVKEKL